ncbi:MAG: helix-turn-helix domain-containing protein, partial [Acutalibacteraceae bacterium]|nr:helix-turn-helix domain-containing protein [Acutalibacteraceae bacterium]
MPKIYKINAEEVGQIKEVRKRIRDKKVDKRLYAVQLRGEGLSNIEIAEKLDTSDKVVSQWVSKYKKGGIEA